MNNKYKFYEIVKVVSLLDSLKKINGCEGVIRGMSQNEDDGKWGYGVSIYKEDGLVWDVMEDDLIPTGKMANPENHVASEVIRVRVDPETGEGSLVEKDDSQ